jgi:hypothetical protein
VLSLWAKPRGHKAAVHEEIASSSEFSNQGTSFLVSFTQRYDLNDIAGSSKLDSKIFLPPEMDISQFTLERSRK